METVSGEITLYDLIAWEPRLRPIAPRPGSSHWCSLTTIDVDWILTARSTKPMLPSIRGGELIVLPDRIVREIGVPFAALMREISSQPIAGILTDHLGSPDISSGVVVLHTPLVDTETERDLNRLITNGRRDALQRLAELDQAIAQASARNLRPNELATKLSQIIQVPMTVQTPGATNLFATADARDQPEPNSDRWLRGHLRNGYSIWLGPIPPAKHALARFSINHIQEGLQRTFDATRSLTPRGSARVTVLNALLQEPLSADREVLSQKAMSAGVPPDRMLRVAISSAELTEEQVRRSLLHQGDILDAGSLDGYHLWLLASRASTPASREIATSMNGWVALSAAIEHAADLPYATRQATYVSRLLANGFIAGTVAAFDDGSALGIYGLLYPEWRSERQIAYRNEHLGSLLENDPRGLLIETLGVFLDHGGAQRVTAESLGIHRNTLSYRLRQINDLPPVKLDDPHTRLTLHIAVAIHRILTL